MIKTQPQYQNTKRQIRKFQDALANVQSERFEAGSDEFLFQQMDIAGLESQLADLRAEAHQFDQLVSERPSVIVAHSFDELPLALIKARIALGMTQRDLADQLGMREQQIQRYEATDYASASLQRIGQVVRALNVRVREEILLPKSNASLRTLFRQMRNLGLDKSLILQKVLPATLRARIEGANNNSSDRSTLAIQAASAVGRVFDIDPMSLFDDRPLDLNLDAIGAARFRASRTVNVRRLAAYSVYAYRLAGLALRATTGLEPQPISIDPVEFRNAVVEGNRPFDFESVLRYAWSRGVVVLPLVDPGAFHGACWRIDGRNVVVLKQKANLSSRWLLDLLHEIRHAAQDPQQHELAIIEDAEVFRGRSESCEEQAAVQFAVAVGLKGRAEELATLCAQAADLKVERLASVVPAIAKREGVDVGILADYLAYRMGFERPPVNWWGTATNLQPKVVDPWGVAREVLLERIEFGMLDPFERDLLMRAIAEPEE
ncbi:MAG: helix-turn-helix domain-containing protein [Chloroflexota bacterium]|nr:helix-turn-helix domain-containing protein [Chloroflexota bacterium]